MNKTLETAFGVVAGLGFLWAALAIFVWNGKQLQQARDSKGWPRAVGKVISSTVESSGNEKRPRVVYNYTVTGTLYTSRQIAFDLFDKPGGEGRIESILARYPLGGDVTVYYDPTNPATAILEPGIYSPFLMPLFFGVLFLLLSALVLWKTFRQVAGQSVVEPAGNTNHRITIGATIMSALLYLILVLVSFDSAVHETMLKAFGKQPAGVPNIVFVLGLQTLLYLPMPWVCWHVMRLAIAAMQGGSRVKISSILTVGASQPELHRSLMVTIGGLAYFFVICAIWIAIAARRGI